MKPRGKNYPIIAPGGTTFENITLLDQMMGIVIPSMSMVFLRFTALCLGIIIVLCIGEQAAAIILFVTCAYLWTRSLLGIAQGLEIMPAIMAICLALIVLDFAEYWPEVLSWARVENQLHYRLHWEFDSRWLSWANVDTGLVPATPTVVWIRAMAIVVLPLIVASPLRSADWAFWIETLWTQARQVRFNSADPGSVPKTQGFGVKSGTTASDDPDADTPTIVTIPAPIIEGS